jgi:hypothetical protein
LPAGWIARIKFRLALGVAILTAGFLIARHALPFDHGIAIANFF